MVQRWYRFFWTTFFIRGPAPLKNENRQKYENRQAPWPLAEIDH